MSLLRPRTVAAKQWFIMNIHFNRPAVRSRAITGPIYVTTSRLVCGGVYILDV